MMQDLILGFSALMRSNSAPQAPGHRLRGTAALLAFLIAAPAALTAQQQQQQEPQQQQQQQQPQPQAQPSQPKPPQKQPAGGPHYRGMPTPVKGVPPPAQTDSSKKANSSKKAAASGKAAASQKAAAAKRPAPSS
jgi:hypothetical protein